MVWGQKEVGVDGFLHLSAGAGSLGGSVYLKNSLAWANYSFAAKFNWPTGQTVDLMGNYVNASNYVVCEYQRSGPGMVAMRLVQYRGGEDIQLTPDVAVGVTNYDDLNASITLNGAKGICALNGYTSSNAKIGSGVYPIDPVTGGGIGFAMRDPQADINQLIVKNISVRSTP
jgi:hypothetical protein